jgi:uncharacterized membrane protein
MTFELCGRSRYEIKKYINISYDKMHNRTSHFDISILCIFGLEELVLIIEFYKKEVLFCEQIAY